METGTMPVTEFVAQELKHGHFLLGWSTFERNAHGAIIETTVWAPSKLDEKGRCCGRKPVEYKRSPDHHLFCPKCNRDYTPDGRQRQNHTFKSAGNWLAFMRKRPLAHDEVLPAGAVVLDLNKGA